MNGLTHRLCAVVACLVAASGCMVANAQAPAAATPPTAAPATPATAASAALPTGLDQLAWLRGCWSGKVNRRDFLEQWLAPRAGMMVGVSHTIVQGRKQASEWRTEDYTYLRLEARADGVYYIAIPSGKQEMAFKLTAVERDKGDTLFIFAGPSDVFPQRVVYRHTEGGSLFAQVGGKVDGKDKEVIYPMFHVDCATGAIVRE